MTQDQDQNIGQSPHPPNVGQTPDLAETPGWAEVPPPTPSPDLTGEPSEPSGGSSEPKRSRTRASTLERLSRDGLTEAAESAFRGAGGLLNELCAEDTPPGEPPDDIWIPTDDEAESVARPLGRMGARHMPETAKGDPNDIADAISALVPFGIWLLRGLAEWLPRFRQSRKTRKVISGDGLVVRAPETEGQ